MLKITQQVRSRSDLEAKTILEFIKFSNQKFCPIKGTITNISGFVLGIVGITTVLGIYGTKPRGSLSSQIQDQSVQHTEIQY